MRRPFKSVSVLEGLLPPTLVPVNAGQGMPRIAVMSSFFEVRGRLRLEDRVLEQRSLVERRGLEMLVLERAQVSTHESSRP